MLRDRDAQEKEWRAWLRESPDRYLDFEWDKRHDCWRLIGLDKGTETRRSLSRYLSRGEVLRVLYSLIRAVGRPCSSCAAHMDGQCTDEVALRITSVARNPDAPCLVPVQYRPRGADVR